MTALTHQLQPIRVVLASINPITPHAIRRDFIMAAKNTATKAKAAKAAKAAAELEDEVEEVEETETAEVEFGVADIVTLIKTKLNKDTSTRELRTLLRKMARDGRLDREIVAGNRARWVWSGPNDPEVKAVLAAFKSGELEADKQEKLAALKERKAAQKAAAAAEVDEDEDEAPAKAPAKKKAKAKVAPVEVDDDEDLELED